MARHARLIKTKSYQIIDRSPEWVGPWMAKQGGGHWRSGCACIGLSRNGELQAGAMYDHFNGSSIFASLVIRGSITRKWLWYIFYYPFVQLNAKIILAYIALDNPKSLHIAERFGFTLIAAIPDGDPSGALGIYALHRDHCRFLGSPYVKAGTASTS